MSTPLPTRDAAAQLAREAARRASAREAGRRITAVVRTAWGVRGTSIRIGLSFVAPLAIGVAAGHPHEGAIATGGAWAAIYARDMPYRRRLRVMAWIGLSLVAVVVLGTLAAPAPLAVAVGAGLVAGVGSLLCHAFDVGRPREFFLVLAFLAATQYPGGAADAPERAVLVLAGGACVIALAMAGMLVRPRGPEERTLELFWNRLADLLDALGTPRAGEARAQLLIALSDMRIAFASSGHSRGDGDRLHGMAVSGEAAADAALGLVLRDCPPVDPAWPAAARVLGNAVPEPRRAADAAVRDPRRAARGASRAARSPMAAGRGGGLAGSIALPATPPGTVHGERFARMMATAVADADPRLALETTLVPFTRRRRRGPIGAIRRAAHPGSLVLPTALRMAVAVGAGTALGLAIDEQRGIWVGLTTAAVLLASNVTLTARRTAQRITGTVLGVGLAAGLFALEPSIVTVIAALAIFQILMQATLFTAYGVATFFSTPIALLIVDLGVPGVPAGALLGPRIVDTLLGCGVGLLARRFFWPHAASTRLGVAQGMAVEAARDVLHAAMTRSETPSSTLVRRSRRALHAALLNLTEVQRDAVGDLLFSSRAADDRFTLTTAVERLAYAVMGFAAPRNHPPAGRDLLPQLDAALDHLAALVQGFRTADTRIEIPPITAHPATYRAIIELREALANR